MPTKLITSFEVLSSPIAPGVPDVPYIQQGFFLQITNLRPASALLSIEYKASPAFIASAGAIKLFTNIIDGAGTPQQYPTADFLSAPVGYESLNIPAGATWLVGAQYLLLPPPPPVIAPATGNTPQNSFTTRGTVHFTAAAGTKWMVLATVRQVFSTFGPGLALIETDSTAYSVAINGGPEVSL